MAPIDEEGGESPHGESPRGMPQPDDDGAEAHVAREEGGESPRGESPRGMPQPNDDGAETQVAREEFAGVSDGGPNMYFVAQGRIFIKRSKDPTSKQIVKCKRDAGVAIACTGRSWNGPSGGVWAEVDAARCPDEAGWILVQGPGFGVTGPLLIALGGKEGKSGSGEYQTVKVRWCKDPPIFECVMPLSATVGNLLNVFCARTGLNPKETIFTKGLPGKAPNGTNMRLPMDYTSAKDVLYNHMTLKEANIQETLNLVYLGHFNEDYRPSA